MFNHDVKQTDLRTINLPLGEPSANPYSFWLIKLPEDVKPPYQGMLLFVSENADPVNSSVRGMTARVYGRDWDVVSLNGLNYLRWRYDSMYPTGPNSSDDSFSYLTEMGSGTTSVPSATYAPSNLDINFRMMLMY